MLLAPCLGQSARGQGAGGGSDAPGTTYHFPDAVASFSVPLTPAGGNILIPVAIDGRPYPAGLDSGGAYILPTQVAGALGLIPSGNVRAGGYGEGSVPAGYARADRLSIGPMTVRDPRFLVLPVGEIGQEAIVGVELLRALVVTVDLDKDRVVFTRPDAYRYSGTGAVVPLRFGPDGHTPVVSGSLDGIPGDFTIDTGSNTGLELTSAFAAAHHLNHAYKMAHSGVIGSGVGGPDRAAVTRTRVLTLGGLSLRRPVTYISLASAGIGATTSLAGNVGVPLLRQFNITFDYPHRRLIFERNKHFGEADLGNEAGMTVDCGSGPSRVVDVVPGGPAARAGVGVGDEIETIGGREATSPLTYAEASNAFEGPVGSPVRLHIRSGGRGRDVTLILRALVP